MRIFTQTLKFFFLACALVFASNAMGQTYNGTTWYSLYDHPSNQTDGYVNTDKTFDVYAPTTKSCTFEWMKTGYFFAYPGCDIYISQSTNGGSSYGSENHAIESNVFTKQDSWVSKTVSVEENFNKIKFRQGGTLNRHFKNVTIPLAQHIRLVSGTYGTTSVTKNFGDVEWGTSASYKVNFRSFLTNGNITVTIVGDDNGDFSFSSTTHGVHSLTKSDKNRSFSVGANMCASENGAANTTCSTGVLGRASEYDFTVYYYPKKENVGRGYTDNTVYVNITDGKSTAKVILRGNCIKRNQTIVWDNSDATYNTTDNITYNAVANDAISGTASGVSVTYAPKSGSPAYMSGNALQIVTSGNTTITASAAADTYYNAAANVTKNITINKVNPTVTWPVIPSGLKYNESCAIGDKVSDHWTGGSAKDDKNNTVLGTFVCDADLLPANTSYSVTFNPTNTNWYNSVSTTISGIVAKGDQTIDWPLADATTNPATEYATGQLMGATATSGGDVYYTTSDASIATIVDGRLSVITPNASVTITAHADADDNWNAAPERTVTFVTLGTGSGFDDEDVKASDITYGRTLSASTLSGTVKLNGIVIPGTLSWVDPAIMPNAGTAAHMVLFTPDNTAAYSSVYFMVDVLVNKADPVITWNIGNALRENTIYSHFVASTNHEASLSVTESSPYLSVDGERLIVDEIGDAAISSITITATQDESANYNAATSSKTITIYPKVPQCLPVVLDSKTTLDKMGAQYSEPSGWCGSSQMIYDEYTVALSDFDVRYTQAVGIQLGSWQDGFTGLSLAKIADLLGDLILGREVDFKWSTKSIELAFVGIPDRLSFSTELQTVGFSLVGWHDVEPSAANWKIYQKEPGGEYHQVGGNRSGAFDFNEALSENTRYIKIEYTGNFAGFVKNLRITQKKYLREKDNKTELEFGTETHPLQEPQTLTLSYSSLGDCEGTNDYISVTSSNPAFYVDETTITENVGIEQSGEYVVRVRCNDVHQSGTLTFTSNDGTSLEIPVSSEKPAITTSATAIFQTGTEHNPVSGTAYRAQRTLFTSDILEGLFNGSTPLFDTLYIYGVSESAAASREWVYSPAKGYNVPVVTASNVHTPCFVYKKDGAQYTYVRTFDASTKTLNVTDSKTRVFVGYRAEAPATTALQLETGAAVSLNNTEIVATNAAIAVSGNATIAARGANIVSSASKAAIQLAGTATLTINDSWKTAEPSAILALRPASGYPSIDLGSASGRVDINGTQLELHNAASMAIAHMSGTTEKFDGEVYINDGSVGGETTLGMPKLTFINGGTFNDGDVVAYTLKGQPKRPRNSRGEIVSRHTMSPAALASGYSWYGQTHLTLDGSAKVNPMLPDETVWIFNGDAGEGYNNGGSWNKGSVPGETDDVLINAPMVISGGELKVKSLTINWEDKGKGIPAVTISPDGGLTVGEGGIDAIKLANPAENLVLRADQELSSATKGQTGFLRIHPESAEPMPKATVELYSTTWYNKANEAGNTTRFQCVGTPIADEGVVASTVFPTGTLLYGWNESSEKWTNSRTKELVPFKGYDLSQKLSNDGLLVTFTGTLASGDKTIDLAHTSSEKGFNLLANSYTAPISIEEFIDDDFVNASQTIYILNAGTKAESNAQAGGLDAAGKWVGIPAKTASELAAEGYPCVIPSMQGFWVQSTGAGAQLKLNYDRLVMGVTYTEPTANKPLRVAKSRETEQVGKLMINLYTETDADCVFILESDSYDAAYEDGYDARKIASETMDVFTIRDSEQLGVDATNTIEGTRVGVRTGEETTYTFRFSHLQSDKDLVLWDKETKMKVYINEDIEYTFYAVPNSEITERFQIVAANIPTITTGVDEIESETKVQKFIKDNQLYILKDGVLYNATGAVVRK